MLTIDDVLSSPDHFLFALEGDVGIFLPMDRAAYARSIFCDGRVDPASRQAMRINLSHLAEAAGQRPLQSPAYIFHIAHCGSTLLARAIDSSDSLIIREPLALRQVAVEGVHARSEDRRLQARIRLNAQLLGRRYTVSAPTVVKANVPVNFIAERLLALQPDTPAVCLYYPLRDYLAAILRSENHRRWVDAVCEELAPVLRREIGFLDELPTHCRAAALWYVQVQIYQRLAVRFPRVKTLNANRFFAEPLKILTSVHGHFKIHASEETLETRVDGPLFKTSAKQPGVPFDEEARRERQAAVRAAMGSEIVAAENWLSALVRTDALDLSPHDL